MIYLRWATAVALAIVFSAPALVSAQIVRGYNTAALQGGGLTDPDNNANDSGAEDADGNGLYNGIFFANQEPTFSNATGGGPSEAAFDLFDRKVGGGEAKYCCNGGINNVGVDFSGKQFVLTRFNIASDNDSGTNRDPDIWAIQGSNDGLSWTDIFSYNVDGTSPFSFGGGSVENKVLQYDGNGVNFATPAGYSQFRFTSSSYVSGNALGLSELEFFGVTRPEFSANFADGATINFGAVEPNTPATTQLTLSNTGTTNLSEIDLLSYSITGADAAFFELVGFTSTVPGPHGTSAAGDGLLSDGAGNALNFADLDINFLGGDELRDYEALLQIFGVDDNGAAQTLSFNLQAAAVPEPGALAIWLLIGLTACGSTWARHTRQRRALAAS
jgi:hypothetical protein